MTPEGFVLSSGHATGIPVDLVAEVAGVLRYYGCDIGRPGEDIPAQAWEDMAARAILASRSWHERQAAEQRAHARRHEEATRETRTLLDLAEARRRTREHVDRIDGYTIHYTAGGEERR